MRYGRHPQWGAVESCLDKIAGHLGPSILDNRCGKVWDVGQAVCAEAYGPDWMRNVTFREWDNKDDSEPPEPHYLACAVLMSNGYIPEWAKDDDHA